MADIIDGVVKVGEYSANLSELVSSKKEYILKQIGNTFLLLIILMAFGCFDFLHFQFHWEYLADSNFWISVGTKAIADICSYNIGINVIIDDIIKRNAVLVKLKAIYDQLNNLKDKDFEIFINEYNKECKAKAYKNMINHKIYMLNKRSRRKDKLMYSSSLISEEDKLKNRYCVHRMELENLKKDEYVKENIDSLDVRFREIDAAVFEIELNGSEKVVQNKVTGSINKGRFVASMGALVGVIAAPIVINSFGFQPNKEEFEEGVVAGVNYAIRMASDIGVIIWQFVRGIFSAHKIVSEQLTIPMSERVKILKKYYAWREEHGKSVPKCYKDLTEEPQYIEMTEEEYLKSQENKL